MADLIYVLYVLIVLSSMALVGIVLSAIMLAFAALTVGGFALGKALWQGWKNRARYADSELVASRSATGDPGSIGVREDALSHHLPRR